MRAAQKAQVTQALTQACPKHLSHAWVTGVAVRVAARYPFSFPGKNLRRPCPLSLGGGCGPGVGWGALASGVRCWPTEKPAPKRGRGRSDSRRRRLWGRRPVVAGYLINQGMDRRCRLILRAEPSGARQNRGFSHFSRAEGEHLAGRLSALGSDRRDRFALLPFTVTPGAGAAV